jgi:hypothetical protein
MPRALGLILSTKGGETKRGFSNPIHYYYAPKKFLNKRDKED